MVRMRRLPRILAGALIVFACAAAAAGEEPSRFYVVIRFFSDHGALFYHRVVDVFPSGTGSTVRYIRVAPLGVQCAQQQQMVIHSTVATLANKKPGDLAMGYDLCGIRPADLNSIARKYGRYAGDLEIVSYSIVAQCRGSAVVLRLPRMTAVGLDKMKLERPELERLWHLASGIPTAAFSEKDPFYDRTEEEDFALQESGRNLLPELVSGKYDLGLQEAVRGNILQWKSPSFRALLEGYRGPIRVSEAAVKFVPKLLRADQYRFDHYEDPEYPHLARLARVQGRVELELKVQAATGAVESVEVVSGHKLLSPSAIEAAKRWRFAPDSVRAAKVYVTIAYSLECN